MTGHEPLKAAKEGFHMRRPSASHEPETVVVRFAPETLSITPAEIARYAGGTAYVPDLNAQLLMSRITDQVPHLISPKMAYAVHPIVKVTPGGEIVLSNGLSLRVPPRERDQQSRFLSAAICTLGSSLEAKYSQITEAGDLLEAVLLDAAGVALMETLGNMAYRLITKLACREDLYCGCRFAPGHGKMPMSNQAILFQLVSAHDVGVHLNEKMVMSPNKSISFFARWGRTPISSPDAHKCLHCSLRDCAFRI